MSLRFLSSVAENVGFTSSEKLVLLCLADHADEDGLSWPSINRMQRWTSLSRAAIYRTKNRMEKAGIITLEKSKGRVNKYRLSVEAIEGYTSSQSSSSQSSSSQSSSSQSSTPTSTQLTTPPVLNRVHGTVIEPSLESKNKSPSPTNSNKPKSVKRITEIDEPFRQKMRDKYRDSLHDTVDERIDLALSHKAVKKYDDIQQYVNGWLLHDVERLPTKGNAPRASSATPIEPMAVRRARRTAKHMENK